MNLIVVIGISQKLSAKLKRIAIDYLEAVRNMLGTILCSNTLIALYPALRLVYVFGRAALVLKSKLQGG